MLMYAITTITLALVFYSLGVWGEKLQGGLKNWHVVAIWLGFACDLAGTVLMSFLDKVSFALNMHTITGIIAIVLMLFCAIWATAVLMQSKKSGGQAAVAAKKKFHRYGIIIWLIWLVPYVSGMMLGMK